MNKDELFMRGLARMGILTTLGFIIGIPFSMAIIGAIAGFSLWALTAIVGVIIYLENLPQ